MIFSEAITMIQMQRSGIFQGVLHSYRVFKELEVFGSDVLEPSSERLLLHAIFI